METIDIYFILMILPIIIVGISQLDINLSYSKYKNKKTKNNIKGKDVAKIMLEKNNINDVKILKISGKLTDHFDPKNKVIRLSEDVYNGTSIAAVTIAAHETGHVIQHSEGYSPVLLRSRLVPVVSFSSRFGYLILLIGILLNLANLSLVGLAFMSLSLIFQLVTLPVEFDASKRAIKILKSENIIEPKEERGVRRILRAAIVTYISTFFATMLQMLRFLMIFTGSKKRD